MSFTVQGFFKCDCGKMHNFHGFDHQARCSCGLLLAPIASRAAAKMLSDRAAKVGKQ